MALPYPTKVILPFDIATAQDMNERHANDVALAAGTGLNNGAVTASKLDFTTLAFGNYSTSEVDTGFKWVDGKTIYKKTIATGNLPSSGTKNVTHSISGLDFVVNMSGMTNNGSGFHLPLPFIATGSISSQVSVLINGANIVIDVGSSNRSAFAGYVNLYYTKT